MKPRAGTELKLITNTLLIIYYSMYVFLTYSTQAMKSYFIHKLKDKERKMSLMENIVSLLKLIN